MYLRELFIKNNGPIRQLHIDLTFDENDRPIPHIIVGRNGAGKTNLLSVIADALIRGASSVFSDVVTPYGGTGHSYFRVVGGGALTYNEPGGFSILKFVDGSNEYFYAENAGSFKPEDAVSLIPPSLEPGVRWSANRQGKRFEIPAENVRTIFQSGVYMYSPATRFEYPNWLNRDALIEDTYDLEDQFSTTLRKPIYVERGIDKVAQWLLGLITDARAPVSITIDPTQPNKAALSISGQYDVRSIQILEIANSILRIIMDDPTVRFFWGGRQAMRKVGVASGNNALAAGLDSLSGGQASLLSIFGTLLRYADQESLTAPLTAESVQGIVVIDELDAHMHIDLQMVALPKLIALFPNVQFIASSHSPFFALGMEKNFPDNAVRIIDLPTGLAVSAEAYNEFDSALKALAETHAFEEQIGKFLAAAEQPVVWLAGQTDVPYFKTAALLLGYPHLVDYFEWIGVPGSSGGGEYTGDSNLKAAVKFLRANPSFTRRTVIAIFDNDANQADATFDNVHIISLQKIGDAAVVDGIENLLPSDVFTPDVFQDVEKPSGIANKPNILPKLRKVFLVEKLCSSDPDSAKFQNFRPYLDRINEIVTHETAGDSEDETTPADGTASPSH